MKKPLAVLFAVLLALSCFSCLSFASEADAAAPEEKAEVCTIPYTAQLNGDVFEGDEPILLTVTMTNDSKTDLTNLSLTYSSTVPISVIRVSGIDKSDVLPVDHSVIATYQIIPVEKLGFGARLVNVFQQVANLFTNLFIKVVNRPTQDLSFTVNGQVIGISAQVIGNPAQASDEHDFTVKAPGADTLKSEATCFAPAYYYYVCADCGAVSNRVYADGAPKDHDFSLQIADAKYKSADATCTEPEKYFYVCAACGTRGDTTYDVGEPNGHDFVTGNTDDAYLASPATCTETALYYLSCSVCGEAGEDTYAFGSALGHDFSAQNTDEAYLSREATCTEPAVYFYSCSVCGEAGSETFTFGEPNGHDFTKKDAVEENLITPATCTAKATYVYVCSVCGEQGTETYKYGKVLPHQLEKSERVEPTCVTDGKIEFYRCTACGSLFSDKAAKKAIKEADCVIPATGVHTPGAPSVTVLTEAKCFTDGLERVVVLCTVCGQSLSDEERAVNKIGSHTPGEPVYETIVAAGCVENGEQRKSVYCTVCGELIEEETIVLPARGGHTPGEPVSKTTKAPGCFEAGEQVVTTTCSVCGEKLDESVVTLPAYGAHDPVTVKTREPGYVIAGYSGDVVCARCGEKLSSGETIPTKEADLQISETISAFIHKIQDIFSGIKLPQPSEDPVC